MRISEGSPYPPSESDISEIARDVEKEDAIEKLSLLPNPPPRPRCLTASGFRDAAEEPGLPKPTFQHCAYYKLPPDIRRYILILAFGNRRLHMDFSYDYPDMSSDLIQPLDKNHCGIVMENMYGDKLRVVDDTKPRSWIWWGSVCHRLPPDLDVSQTGPMTHGGPDGPWADTCRVGEARHCDSWPGSFPAKCRIGTMGWLLSCRQNYAEAIDILYSKNTIIMANEAMITHLPQLLLPQRLASITSLEVSWNLKSRYESGFWNIIDEADLKHAWRSADGEMDVIRLPYVDSYPKAPYHMDSIASKGHGYWILNGTNLPKEPRLYIGPPPMSPDVTDGHYDSDPYGDLLDLEDIR
ncbi:hypothetical protein FNYG_00109 [Fusarium nygamai]|uniref:DUF7730 domain-containing protein n=1 Tax=Gibberella nygamai TaxID=42673 RepID=A0A2K0WVW1_GIBNY|nr:hypothetical protein FNYG_00109 [Fusarium nygamai]